MVISIYFELLNSIKREGLVRGIKLNYKRYISKKRSSKFDPHKAYKIKVNNYKLEIIPDDQGISKELFLYRIHEPLCTSLIKKEIKNGFTCIDIGSNIGYYAILESKLVGKNGSIICLEPSPLNFYTLQKNIKINKCLNIHSFNLACGDRDGEIIFTLSNSSNWSRVIEEVKIQSPENEITTKINVPIKKIDTLLEEVSESQIDLIRMDVEGYEFHVYRGMKSTIKKFKPLLVIELHKKFLGKKETENFLLELKKDGYKIKYYIPREKDLPLVGNMKYVTRPRFENLIELINDDLISEYFTLFLTNSTITSKN